MGFTGGFSTTGAGFCAPSGGSWVVSRPTREAVALGFGVGVGAGFCTRKWLLFELFTVLGGFSTGAGVGVGFCAPGVGAGCSTRLKGLGRLG